MNKETLSAKLKQGYSVWHSYTSGEFPYGVLKSLGVFKAKEFPDDGASMDDIIYISDLPPGLNMMKGSLSDEEIKTVLDHCYTPRQFILLTSFDTEEAKELFHFCRGQEPVQALVELVLIRHETEDEPVKTAENQWKPNPGGLKNIYLIVGPSGVGKTTLVNALEEEFGYKAIESYTDRPQRYPDEKGHIFLSREEFDNLGKLVAYTEYNGNRYGVTSEIVDSHDLYVIDPYGVQFFLDNYKGKKGVVVFGLTADAEDLIERMQSRGDSDEKILARLKTDKTAFDYNLFPVYFNKVFQAKDKEYTKDAVAEAICYYEEQGTQQPLREYLVTVNRPGYVKVVAQSKADAIREASSKDPEEIEWEDARFSVDGVRQL